LQPLEGIAVASPAVNLLGPLLTSRLAEFGASVTKVEPRPGSRRQGKEIGSDGNGNARGCEVVRMGVRRDRLSGTTAGSIAALNSTAGSPFGDPRGRGQRTGRPATDETVPKTAVPPLFRTLRLRAGTARARRTPGQQVFGGQSRPCL
jgi:hypothetical protein